MDAIHYKVKENHQYVNKAAYVVLGITMDGIKDVLGGRGSKMYYTPKSL